LTTEANKQNVVQGVKSTHSKLQGRLGKLNLEGGGGIGKDWNAWEGPGTERPIREGRKTRSGGKAGATFQEVDGKTKYNTRRRGESDAWKKIWVVLVEFLGPHIVHLERRVSWCLVPNNAWEFGFLKSLGLHITLHQEKYGKLKD